MDGGAGRILGGELENVYGDPVSLWVSNRILWLERKLIVPV